MGACTNYCNRCVGDDKTQLITDQNQIRTRVVHDESERGAMQGGMKGAFPESGYAGGNAT